MTDKLTPKQEAFALKYVECSNASEAYRTAYDVGENTTPESIWVNACKTLANDKVAQRVVELQEEAKERAFVTIRSITEELEEARIMALKNEQSAAMTQATMGKAKVNGLLVDRVDQKTAFTVTIGKDAKDL